jgi:hypothetical protein
MLMTRLAKDTVMPAPGETIRTQNPLEMRAIRRNRFRLAMTALAQQVHSYYGGNSSLGPYIEERVVRPILETIGTEYAKYVTPIPVAPVNGVMRLEPMLMQSVHQLHILFSVAFPYALPPAFQYANLPLQTVAQMSSAYMRVLAVTLFRLTPDGNLESGGLFDQVAEYLSILSTVRPSHFIEDTMQQGMAEVAGVMRGLVEVLRRVAHQCYAFIAEVFPFLYTNPRYRAGIESLDYAMATY